MLTGGNRSYLWDADNRVTSVTTGGTTSTMDYDYAGIRVKKNSGGGITYIPFDGYEIGPGNVITKYIKIGIEAVAAKKSTGEKLFYHNDHLGGINVITDLFGAKVQLTEYDPWGKVSRSEGSTDLTHGFTGQQLDPESGLYYYGGRYYDPELGRFISADPFVGQPDDPQNLNRFSYVVNNPQNYIDPDGYFHRHKIKKRHGFFGSIFGRIFRILFDIALIFAGLPPVEGGGIGLIGGAAHLFTTAASLATNNANTGISGVRTSGPFTPEALAAGGGGFLSPSLMLAMEAGCDVCSDLGWDWLRSLFTIGLAQAASSQPRYRVDQAGIDFIKRHEGFRANVYHDPSKRRLPTIGYGHQIFRGENIQGPLTVDQGLRLLQRDLEIRVQPFLNKVTVPLLQNQVNAIGSFIFNAGGGVFTRLVLPALNAGDFEAAADAMAGFTGGGPGIVTRRREEVEMFLSY